jgi:hypothetical protein
MLYYDIIGPLLSGNVARVPYELYVRNQATSYGLKKGSGRNISCTRDR